jgi:hypothetical protein
MSNIVTVNSGSAINGSLKAGRVSISTDSSVTPSSGGKTWYNMINPAGGYTFISDPKIQGYNDGPPIIYPTQTSLPADILATVNGLPDRRGSVPFDNVWDALVWVQSTGKYFILDKTLNGPSSDEIVFVLDGSNYSSYPQSGSNAFDISNTSTSGILENGVEFDEVTNSFVFDGTDDRIRMTNKSPLGQAQEWSLSALVKFTQNSNWNVIVDPSSYGTACNYMLWLHSGSPTKLMATYDGSWSYGTIALSPDRWYHLSLTKASSGGKVRFFVNGEFDVERTLSFNTNTNVNDLYLGRRDNGDYQLPGNIANLRLYNKKLSDPQIKQNHFGAPIVTDNLSLALDASNLVSYPKSGDVWYSLAGSQDAEFYNGPTYVDEFGGGISRDGIDDFISASIDVASTTTNFSVETWFKANPSSGYRALISAWNTGAGGAGGWEFQFYNGTLGLHPTYTVAYDPETVAHVVYTQEGTTAKIYLNGVLAQTQTLSTDLRDGRIGIGNLSGPGYASYNLDSTFYKVRVYEKTLSEPEILQNYTAEYSKFKSSRDIPKDGLVLDLDAGNPNSYLSGTTWTDLSGQGNNGTLNNGVGYTTDNGGTLTWDGTDDTVSLGSLGTIGNTQTISVWFNSSAVENYRNVLDMNYSTYSPNTGNTGPRLEQYTNGNLTWIWSGNTTNNNIYNTVGTGTIIPNTWYHAVFVQNSGNVSLYLNGVLINTNTSPQGYLTTYGDVVIGRGFVLDSSRYFAGKESSVKIYNRALSSAEVSNLYTSMAPRYQVQLPRSTTDSLKLNLDAGDITSYPREGTTWYDRSGKGNNGTLTNGPTYIFENGGVISF